MNVRWLSLAALGLAAVAAGCGGGGGTVGTPSVSLGGSGSAKAGTPPNAGGSAPTVITSNPTAAPGSVTGVIRMVIPTPAGTPQSAQGESETRGAQYLSPGTAFAAVRVVTSSGLYGAPFVYGATSASPQCTSTPSGTACTLPFYAPPGNDTIQVATLGGAPTGVGLVLSASSSGATPVPIAAGQANNYSTTLYGVVRSFSNSGNACPPADGAQHTLSYNQTWLDATGYTINGALWAPVQLAELDTSGAYNNLAPLNFQTPSPTPPAVTVTYNGAGGNNVGVINANVAAPDTGATSVPFLGITPVSTPSPSGTVGPHYVYAAQPSVNSVAIVNVCSRVETGLITIPSATSLAKKMYLDSTKTNGFILAPGDNAVYYVSGINNTSMSNSASLKIPLSGSPVHAALSPDGSILYVTDSAGIERISTASTPAVTGTPIPDPSGAAGIAVTNDGSTLYVANESSSSVAVFSATSGTSVATPIPVGMAPNYLQISSDGSTVAVANTGSASVSLVKTASNAVASTLTVAGPPGPVEFQKNGNLWLVTLGAPPTLTLVPNAASTPGPLSSTPLYNGILPRGIGVSPVTNTVYVTGGNDAVQDYDRAGLWFTWGRSVLVSPQGVTAGP